MEFGYQNITRFHNPHFNPIFFGNILANIIGGFGEYAVHLLIVGVVLQFC